MTQTAPHRRSLCVTHPGTEAAPDVDVATMQTQAQQAAALLKALSHEGRLMILCNLVEGEKSVSELEERLGSRQAAVSQQLARLRQDGMVQTRREGKAIYYSLADDRARRTVELMYQMFCSQG
ncbi:metalloregulator ArsR/SmtB family transcription factor [Pseudoruegeria sp. SHC-113]|nr:metalloregulator ArsR/SmtB family transcription factor [Pseudoruegeria sp. SHC-113]